MNLIEFLKSNGFTNAIDNYWSGHGISFNADLSPIIVLETDNYSTVFTGSKEQVLDFLRREI